MALFTMIVPIMYSYSTANNITSLSDIKAYAQADINYCKYNKYYFAHETFKKNFPDNLRALNGILNSLKKNRYSEFKDFSEIDYKPAFASNTQHMNHIRDCIRKLKDAKNGKANVHEVNKECNGKELEKHHDQQRTSRQEVMKQYAHGNASNVMEPYDAMKAPMLGDKTNPFEQYSNCSLDTFSRNFTSMPHKTSTESYARRTCAYICNKLQNVFGNN